MTIAERVVSSESDRAMTKRETTDRRLFLAAAIVFPLIVGIGFARTYYLKTFFDPNPLPSLLVHAHGFVMTVWVALFVAQVWLIRSHRVSVHRQLGIAGVVLAVAVVVLGFFTLIAAAKNGSRSTPPGFPPLAFMAVPFFDLVMLVILFGAAISLRRRSADHKRLMLLVAISLLPPALGRIPLPGLVALGPVFFFGTPTLLMLAALTYDRLSVGRMNRMFAIGAGLLIASYPLRMIVSGTEPWLHFAKWLTGFSIV